MKEASASPRLREYLQRSRTRVEQGEARRFVLGNEAADLDSMVSAVACGYLLSELMPGDGSPFVPLVNAPRADFKLRTEAAFLFASLGLGPEHLSFIDDVDLDALEAGGRLELVLVDHNVPAQAQQALAGAVTGVVDHHKDEGCFQQLAMRIVEPVGSAATLVAERLLGTDASGVEPALAELLLGTILLDTVNFDPQAQRATPKDVAVARQLQAICGADCGRLFEQLQFEKFNVAALDTADLLRKDYKSYRFGAVRCGIASVLLPVATWLEKDPGLAASLSKFARAQQLDLLLVMTAFSDPGFRRELVVLAVDEAMRGRVLDFLGGSELGLVPMAHASAALAPDIALFSQANVAYSRKKLQPLLQSFLG